MRKYGSLCNFKLVVTIGTRKQSFWLCLILAKEKMRGRGKRKIYKKKREKESKKEISLYEFTSKSANGRF